MRCSRTVRPAVLFIALLGCSGAAPAPIRPPATPPPPPPPDAAIDAPPPLALRGQACDPQHSCDPDLTCADLPGGYCTSACGLAVPGGVCPDGVCVATARSGEQCLKGCTSDADCRAAEGYLCDQQWAACMIPNSAVIVPRQCPAPRGLSHDKAFAPAVALSSVDTPGLHQLEPAAVMTSLGELIVLFGSQRGVADPGQLGSALVGPRGVRTTRFPVDAGDRAQVRLARDAKGILYAVWLEVEGRHRQISIARSRDGGITWTGPDPVDAADCADRDRDCLDRPMIAVGSASPSTGLDLIHVMYAAGGGLRIATSHDEGNTFHTAITALVAHHGNAAVGADGRVHIVAIDPGSSVPGFGSADHRIVYAVSTTNGTAFGKAQKLSGRDEMLPFYGSNPSIALDGKRGFIYAAYVRGGRDAVWDLVILASKDKGVTWKRTRIGDDPPTCAIHMVPNLAVDPTTGTLHVAWYDNRGPARFAHATCTPGAVKCTQQGAINALPFAALSTERDAPRAVGESAALVVDDRRRTLHAVWTQPVDEGGKVVSRIFHASATLPNK